MKRKTASKSPSPVKTRAIAAHHLAAVRGGGGLGIAVEVLPLISPDMQNQHNETLIQL
jgi:hypothetical protein